MRQRLLRICLLAYPRKRRHADGETLLDLAGELAEENGTLREAGALAKGGVRERLELHAAFRALASRWNGRLPSVLGFCFGIGLLVAGFASGGSRIFGWLTIAVFVGWYVTAVRERRARRAARLRNRGH